MNTDLKFVSLADSVFERIEDNILSGLYPKGAVYTESALSEQFGVSRTPIREAIRRLEQENLIRITTKGIEVKGMERQDLADIYEIRSRIEGLAAARCAATATPEILEKLEETLDLQEYYTQKGMWDKIKDTDSLFHEILYNACGSSVYLSVLSNLHRRIQKYRKISVQNPGRAAQAVREHRQLYEALASHDGEKARLLTEVHVANARESILASFPTGETAQNG